MGRRNGRDCFAWGAWGCSQDFFGERKPKKVPNLPHASHALAPRPLCPGRCCDRIRERKEVDPGPYDGTCRKPEVALATGYGPTNRSTRGKATTNTPANEQLAAHKQAPVGRVAREVRATTPLQPARMPFPGPRSASSFNSAGSNRPKCHADECRFPRHRKSSRNTNVVGDSRRRSDHRRNDRSPMTPLPLKHRFVGADSNHPATLVKTPGRGNISARVALSENVCMR